MTQEVATRHSNNVDMHKVNADFASLIEHVRRAPGMDEVNEVRARVEAAKAWAKAYKRTKEVRLNLLRLEVEALVRVVQLGGEQELPSKDREAAKRLAAMSAEQREELLGQDGSYTTAAGMLRARDMRFREEERLRKERAAGERYATEPDPEFRNRSEEESHEKNLRFNRSSGSRRWSREQLHEAVHDALEHVSAQDSEPFTVSEVAGHILDEALIDVDDCNSVFVQGVREAARRAIAKAPVLSDHDADIDIPRYITAGVRTEDGHEAMVRIPGYTATLSHLQSDIEMREKQLAQDRAALNKLQGTFDTLMKMPGATLETQIGRLAYNEAMQAAHQSAMDEAA